MLIITAPSKTQNQIKRLFPFSTEPRFLARSEILIDRLQSFSLPNLCSLMKTSVNLGTSTRQRILDFRPPLTLSNSRQAIFTFQGDAYESLTPETYTEEQLHHAQNHFRILSGLYGILRPLDLMFPYRLEMGCKLAGKGYENLYQFWGDAITDAINADCADHQDQTVVNLASDEYFRVINAKRLVPRLVTVTFQQKKNDDYRTVPIHSKRARGMMIHFMITNHITQAEHLKQFNQGNYRLCEEMSTTDRWFFRQDDATSL